MGKHAQVMDSIARASDKPYLSVEETCEDGIKSSGEEVTFPANEEHSSTRYWWWWKSVLFSSVLQILPYFIIRGW